MKGNARAGSYNKINAVVAAVGASIPYSSVKKAADSALQLASTRETNGYIPANSQDNAMVSTVQPNR